MSFPQEFIKPGSHSHMFCTALQLASLCKFLVKEVKEMDEGSTSRADSKRTSSDKKEAVFNMDSVLLHYTPPVGTYNQYQGALKAHHTDVMEHAIHF